MSRIYFKNEIKKYTFDKNGYDLDYHEVAGQRWQHLQDMIRLEDKDEKRYYMGTFSQNCSDEEGGMVFVAELPYDSESGKVIWCDVLHNNHESGGFNHPGDLRRIEETVVIAGQNWDGGNFAPLSNTFGDEMKEGKGGQAVLFYDVSTPSEPKYMGKLASYKDKDGNDVPIEKDISEIHCGGWWSDHSSRYYLSIDGDEIKLKAEKFTPDAQWVLIESGKDTGGGGSPVSFAGVKGGARLDGDRVLFDKLVFYEGNSESNIWRNSDKVKRETVFASNRIPKTSFGDGTTFTLNRDRGSNCIVYANVESDDQIEIEEIEGRSDDSPITDLFLLYGDDDVPEGYTKIDVDLNREADGADIVLCYTRDESKGAIWDIRVEADTGWDYTPTGGYIPVPNNDNPGGLSDLNKNAGGSDVFMFYTRNQYKKAPIQEVDILIGEHTEAPAGWEKIDTDLNQKAGGNYLWLCFSRKKSGTLGLPDD
jgi:hypothetical protein